MQRDHVAPVTTLALAATLALGAAVAAPHAHAETAERAPYTFAVIGDVPYGSADEAAFPSFVDRINADPDVAMVTHLGDIKSGSTTCTDQRFANVAAQFARFQDPLVYTPGDNEWTDCHRVNNGGYQPLERLAKVRQVFFPSPGTTLGAPSHVTSQASQGVPENVRYVRGGVSFATLHVVGSNDDLNPWDGIGNTEATPEQVSEEQHRMAAAVENVRAAFRTAKTQQLGTVVLQQQADMFDPTVSDPQPSAYSAFEPLVQTLVDESRRFHGRVYLFNGDSHRFNVDRPLADGSSWLSFYGVKHDADNLQRVTVDGSDRGEVDWLKVRVADDGALEFTQVFNPAS